jgi:hypothetical protein
VTGKPNCEAGPWPDCYHWNQVDHSKFLAAAARMRDFLINLLPLNERKQFEQQRQKSSQSNRAK